MVEDGGRDYELSGLSAKTTRAGIYRLEKSYATILIGCAIILVRVYLTVFIVASLMTVGISAVFFHMAVGTIF